MPYRPDFYIGTMGYAYKAWQEGVFYPAGMPQRQFLAHYSQIFNAVELDNTFYGIPRPETVQRWVQMTPEAFMFCPKTPRQITHELRLGHAARAPMAAFLETMRQFGTKLGPILIQFPPDFTADERASLVAFLLWLPEDMRFTVEFRHRSWYKRSTSELLQEHDVAWTSADYIYLPTAGARDHRLRLLASPRPAWRLPAQGRGAGRLNGAPALVVG